MTIKFRERRLGQIPIRRNIPNMITSGNLLCGMIALTLIVQGRFLSAAWLIPMAVFFDFSDGMAARAMGVSSPFGVEFDSLGDVVSFGVTPALLTYSVYLRSLPDTVGIIVAAYFALCGALRLARFNVMHVPGPFQGLPIPAAGIFLASWVLGKVAISPLMMAALTVMAGTLMISSVPYSNLKSVHRGSVHRGKSLALIVLVLVAFAFLRGRAFLVFTSMYIISGLICFDWSRWLSLSETSSKNTPEA